MDKEKAFYAILAVIVIVGGVAIGAAYYGSVISANNKSSSIAETTSLTLFISSANWFHNGTVSHGQPAYFVVAPNGSLESAANIVIPAHTKISLTLIDGDGYGLTPIVGNNGTSNQTAYAKVTGTIGNTAYCYNYTNVNGTLPSPFNSSNNISVPGGHYIHNLAWQGNSSGGYDIAHTFTVLNSQGNIMLNIPSPGMAIVQTQFYINQTGVFSWQCYVPCGLSFENGGWSGAMTTSGWMLGTVTVVA
ncbi:MAG: hypothetical protein ACYDAO_09775 [Thermoplasmataceae archaeon]